MVCQLSLMPFLCTKTVVYTVLHFTKCLQPAGWEYAWCWQQQHVWLCAEKSKPNKIRQSVNHSPSNSNSNGYHCLFYDCFGPEWLLYVCKTVILQRIHLILALKGCQQNVTFSALVLDSSSNCSQGHSESVWRAASLGWVRRAKCRA